jgi:outer membrane protein TolC
MSATRLALAAACLVALPGCAVDRSGPLSAQLASQALQSRSLTDPRLAAFLEAADPRPPGAPRRWDLASLTLAALYFHPSLDVARAQLEGARATVRQASQRPDPRLTFEELSRTTTAPVQWTITPLIELLIEGGGKRAARTREARAEVDAARAALLTQSWSVRAGVRDALIALWAARQQQALQAAGLGMQQQLTTLLEHRQEAGEASGLEVARERTRLDEALLASQARLTQLEAARAQLAAALGVPLAALDGVEIVLDALDAPGTPADDDRLRQRALTGRSDVQELLAQYSAAQAALSLALAGQYPDLTLSPGYSFDTVQNRYLLTPALTLPLHGNRGAIAVARAHLAEVAARFTALQARIIGAVDDAQVEHRAAVRTLDAAQALEAAEAEREARTARAFAAGAIDRPDWLVVQLEHNVAATAQLAARVRERTALSALEDALQQPLLGPALPQDLTHGQEAR